MQKAGVRPAFCIDDVCLLVPDMGLVVAVIAVTLDNYCVEGGIDFCHFLLSIDYIGCCDVVFKVFEASAAGDRHNPRFLV